MSNTAAKIYLVAGATRGIGLALVAQIAAQDTSAIIYAGGRNPSGAPKLLELAAKYPGRVVPVKYVAGDKEGNEALAKEIGGKHGKVDTLIANAAIGNYFGKVHEVPTDVYSDHFFVNVVGPIVLFQAFRSLLKASSLPRFVPITSSGGSIELIALSPFDIGPYGASKAALNWVVRKIHFENEWLVAYPQCPGAVDTDMAKEFIASDKTGVAQELISKMGQRQPEEAASMLVDILDASMREKDGGQFHNIDGGRYPW